MASRHSERSRSFCMILYEDDSSHMQLLDLIVERYNFAFIRHDKDIWSDDVIDENTGEIKYKKGESKKPHYHVVIDFPNPRSRKKVQEQLGIDFLMTCNFYFYIRYLIHEDDYDKYQYKKEEIETNMLERVYNAIGREYKKEEQETRLLYKHIVEQNFITFRQLTDYAMEHGLIQELKKNTYFYKSFCDNPGYGRW